MDPFRNPPSVYFPLVMAQRNLGFRVSCLSLQMLALRLQTCNLHLFNMLPKHLLCGRQTPSICPQVLWKTQPGKQAKTTWWDKWGKGHNDVGRRHHPDHLLRVGEGQRQPERNWQISQSLNVLVIKWGLKIPVIQSLNEDETRICK